MAENKQRVALVTGGMGGLGEAICAKLALGHTVVTTHSPGNTKSPEWLAAMKDRGYTLKAYPCDVADFDSCAAAVKKIEAENGPVHVLVKQENNRAVRGNVDGAVGRRNRNDRGRRLGARGRRGQEGEQQS